MRKLESGCYEDREPMPLRVLIWTVVLMGCVGCAAMAWHALRNGL